jgi:hypothetical protein
MENATCQVCGREIKASSGLTAHHGYKRPYEGWQTASCEGARYVPYEVGCERLREVASQLFDFIVRTEKTLAEFLANPPETLTVTSRRGAWSKEETRTYTKPDDFGMNNSYKRSIPRTYECVYEDRRDVYENTIKWAKIDYQTMQRRLEEWPYRGKEMKWKI